ncbi:MULTISPECIES: VOC family protein [unclassified Alteromonas]|uniref:VOC family protein n=1 Tax=unclassified Alteromonas TaxID=2614992 RepID=UPI000C5B3355|nr:MULTISPECIES: VOC family protein [unclassified Alteromonas]AYA64990.1 VOC family protein [Alteromonas sp. RKMC-009]MBT80785.1 lactoylglutathione lyase [Alteromonadaceae bacterium]MDO6477646.1 VOC family protein [Alteromonas sp. 1_MG-2023]MEC7692063.1 VOC family protein [Pseudomonadota bacterium]
MNLNPVGWFEIYVSDMSRAQTFYESVFMCELETISVPADESLVMKGFGSDMTAYGASGALVSMEGMTPGGTGTLVYFSCDDCAIECARVPKAGGTVIKEKFPIGEYGFVALLQDSEGNMIGLHSQK